MKIPATAIALITLQNALLQSPAEAAGAPDPLEFSETIGMQVEKVGSVPAINTAAFSYNMYPADTFDEYPMYFIDQKEGLVYSYYEDGTVTKVFDMTTSPIPAGMTLDFTFGAASAEFRVQQMSQGAKKGEVYVVMMSSTLPDGWKKADAELPAEGAFPGWVCTADNGKTPEFVRDLYRVGETPSCFDNGVGTVGFTVYQVFVKYCVDEDGDDSLTDPEPFFVLENQMTPGHLGGGIATVDKGKILWSVGDCLPFGTTGLYAPQLESEHCGKILLIDPKKGDYEVAAKGVRNSQQFRVVKQEGGRRTRTRALKGGKDKKKNKGKNKGDKDDELLVFMDIGGVTAEEMNAKSLDAILDTDEIENFGWGRSIEDGMAREGTFYVGPGSPGTLGTEPPYEGEAPIPEEGYEQPWTQFGRTAEDVYYGISGFAVAPKSFNELALIWTEFNTGLTLGTTEAFVDGEFNVNKY